MGIPTKVILTIIWLVVIPSLTISEWMRLLGNRHQPALTASVQHFKFWLIFSIIMVSVTALFSRREGHHP